MPLLEIVHRQLTPSLLLLSALTTSGCFAQHTVTQMDNEVELYYWLPDARYVFCVTSATDFKRQEAVSDGKGGWLCKIEASAEFSYFFIVDGRNTIPDCTITSRDDFGGDNCIYEPSL